MGIPENISKQIAFVQALGSEFLLRYVELPLLGFVLFVLAIDPAHVKKWAKEVADWVRRLPESDEAQDLETRERWRGQDALQVYLDQMQQWLDDENRPLTTLPYSDPPRKLARTWTLAMLKRMDQTGKGMFYNFYLTTT